MTERQIEGSALEPPLPLDEYLKRCLGLAKRAQDAAFELAGDTQ